MARTRGLLIKVKGDGAGFAASAPAMRLGPADIEPILSVPAPAGTAMAAAGEREATWFRVDARGGQAGGGWDDAHAIIARGSAFAAAGGPEVLVVEPDIEQSWDDTPDGDSAGRGMAAGGHPVCTFDDQETGGGRAAVPGTTAWHLGANFSQFATAQTQVSAAKQARIVIAHLDTGYDDQHSTVPRNLDAARQRNFVRGEPPNSAVDRAPSGTLLANRGHGTGTLSILAGNTVPSNAPGWNGFTGFVGAAPNATVIPVRIANSVVHFTTSSMVQGFDYARAQGAHVLTMSMGGVSSRALVDAVNLAYDAGVVLVTAAGNNFAGIPSPKSIVFPARYRRVLAACGVMADGRAYAGLTDRTMQGNYGPAEKMATALGAFTPNLPWAEIGCANIIDMNGSGTSSATPQIAAAAALWLAEHWDVVKAYPQAWMRVEAVRHALFTAAAKSTARMGAAETLEKLGQGVLLANAALAVRPRAAAQLRRLPPAQDSWSWTDLIFGGGVSLAPAQAIERQRRQMLALELTQMAQRVAEIDAAITNPEADPATISAAARNRYLEAALDLGNPSKPLRAFLEHLLGRASVKPAVPGPRPPAPLARKLRPLPPPGRRLRIYALDPSVAKRLDSVSVHETTITVPWDDQPATAEPLRPGPVGEYLEVVDIDPASRRVYDPVDLNDKTLLAQDGLPPSEGNPQFHQQMVYGVAMATIGHFERALGRKALWAPHYAMRPIRGGEMRRTGYEVPRLRLYPHALRVDNAYYSPDKKAVLFGYFQAGSKDGDTTTPGSTVFSCLSSDIIAHEVSHALLDGLHRRFQEASNPDVPAFHEAFADIVALFQHFTMRDLVKFEIAKSRGDLSVSNLLQGLAQQFGEGSGRAGPLRDYGKPGMADLDYDKTRGAHDRGSILVFAVYQAFLAIVARRTADLTHLATGGTGILPAGALHPGLVDRLADETVKTARQVLTMCIRALDYCPAVDITFGEYLRALITADIDVFPEDKLHYRTAFMEAFRRWKLLPRDVRTVSDDTLMWGSLVWHGADGQAWLGELLAGLDFGLNRTLSRSEIFRLEEDNRWTLWRRLNVALKKNPEFGGLFGLAPDLPRYGASGELAKRPGKGETTFEVFGVRPTRRVAPDGSFRTELIAVIQQRVPVTLDGELALEGVPDGADFFWFRGGATVIIDPRRGQEEIRYSIIKNTLSKERRQRQAEVSALGFGSPLRSLYFGDEGATEPFAMLHADHGDQDNG